MDEELSIMLHDKLTNALESGTEEMCEIANKFLVDLFEESEEG